jgi:hypothetical protein
MIYRKVFSMITFPSFFFLFGVKIYYDYNAKGLFAYYFTEMLLETVYCEILSKDDILSICSFCAIIYILYLASCWKSHVNCIIGA